MGRTARGSERMTTTATLDPDRVEKWAPANVLAVFEFGSQKTAASKER